MSFIQKTKSQKKAHKHLYFDHKDVELLNLFINQFGQIETRGRSVVNSRKPVLREYQQKRLSKAVKRARYLALMPYTKDGAESDTQV